MLFLGWTRWLKRTFGRTPRRVRRRGYRPRVEGLESRWVPTVLAQPHSIPILTEGVASPPFAVATFTTTDSGPPPASAFQAQIDWGDGQTSAGTITSSVSGYTVTGSHTYADESPANQPYAVNVTIQDSTDNSSGTAQSSAAVLDGALTAAGVDFTTNEKTTFSGVVATFQDANPSAPTTDFTVTIAWGDGQSSSGTVSGTGGSFAVHGSHVYAKDGFYTTQVTIVDDGGATAVVHATATANETDLVVTAKQLSGTEGMNLTGSVATFTEPDVSSPGAFTAQIDWGDGTTTSGSIGGQNGSFTVSGNHAYLSPGDFTFTVTVTKTGAPNGTASSANVAHIADANVLTPTGVNVNTIEGEPFTGAVATFTDTYTAATASIFVATIDWGDSQTSSGTITGSNGHFSVSGSHTYGATGTFNVKVSIHDLPPGTASASTTSNAAVAAEVLTARGVAFTGTEWVQLNDRVATFTTNNTVAASNEYVATIDWADGSTTAGTIAGGNGQFTVNGTHAYHAPGAFMVNVTITHNAAGAANARTQADGTIASELLPDGTHGTPNQRFILEVYHQILGRSVDQAGLNAFTAFMTHGGTPAQVVQILLSSMESLSMQVQSMITHYLHRAADSMLLNAGVQFLAAGGTREQFASILIGSAEYFMKRGGGANDGFLTALYTDTLQRSVDPVGHAFFGGELTQGMSRQTVAMQILLTDEYRRVLINSFYVQILLRPADTTGRESMLGLMKLGARDEAIMAILLSSQEFFNRFAH
jgi:hypothetical protein